MSGEAVQVVELVECPGCGRQVPARDQCERCGRFLPGNDAALVHGARRLLSGAGSPLDRARQREVRDAVLRDLGGREAVSAVMAELVEDFAFCVVVLKAAREFMQVRGPMREHGGERPVLGIYERFSRRAERLARRIGTEKGRAAEAAARSHLTPMERMRQEPEAEA